jgi:hypothetical protein
VTEPSHNGASGDRSQTETTQRVVTDAERIAEQWAERIGRWVLRTTARAKEEAEDIWADAQAVRRDL